MTDTNTNETPKQVGGARNMLGDFAPKLAELTDDVLFDDFWNRPELSARDRSLVTIAVLAANGDLDQLTFHLSRGLNNGLTQDEIKEAITQVAFYAGWPKGMGAMNTAKRVFTEN
ncbi:carboxymuconolactone decarboxylase family protein [Curtobacterium sp. ISL-83]|uniref:carboxymuconolactone decarboxylase family protein n=1 Tax=Curtobacterium sp. ISL-83 TaxID=2819145 RepID=UPI001BE55FE9|nr:carboxymuconolactone decarboxylase family protein [Curtobacterium sp. ISL-83]MBT2501709.1 carboxymuconolactone decarboxylase family protein [Curtobacterium sp. ISL-83]